MINKKTKNSPIRKVILLAGTISGFVFGTVSLSHLDPVCPQLQEVTHLALQRSTVDFAIIEGWRSQAQHLKNVAKGVSWVSRSKHQDGLAIDFMAYVDGKKTWAKGRELEVYGPIGVAFKQASAELGIPIIWGGDWRVRDFGHVELVNACVWPQMASDSKVEMVK